MLLCRCYCFFSSQIPLLLGFLFWGQFDSTAQYGKPENEPFFDEKLLVRDSVGNNDNNISPADVLCCELKSYTTVMGLLFEF